MGSNSKKPGARLGDIAGNHGPWPPTPIIEGSNNVTFDGRPAARQGDKALLHVIPNNPPHWRSISEGVSSVLINGKPAARASDGVGCGGRLLMGSPSIFVGNQPKLINEKSDAEWAELRMDWVPKNFETHYKQSLPPERAKQLEIEQQEQVKYNHEPHLFKSPELYAFEFEKKFASMSASDYEKQERAAEIALKHRGEAGEIESWQEFYQSELPHDSTLTPQTNRRAEVTGYKNALSTIDDTQFEDAAFSRYQKAWLLDMARANDETLLEKYKEELNLSDDPLGYEKVLNQAKAMGKENAENVLRWMDEDEQQAMTRKMHEAARQHVERIRLTPDNTIKPVRHVHAGEASGMRNVKGSWHPEIEAPAPNTIYDVTTLHDGQPVVYSYETDDLGRVVRVKASLALSIADVEYRDKRYRNATTQAKYGGGAELPEYDGGHLVGTLFQGPAEKVNVVPQFSKQNRGGGKWHQMEKKWRHELRKGNTVDVEIQVVYDDDGQVPTTLIATTRVNDGEPDLKVFPNK